MSTIHTISKITLSGKICPNHFDRTISLCDVVLEDRMTTYLVHPRTGLMMRVELDYRSAQRTCIWC